MPIILSLIKNWFWNSYLKYHIREYRSQEFCNCTRCLTWSIDSGSSEHFHSWYSVTPFSLCCLFAGHYSYPKPNILNSPIAINILSFILFWFIVPYSRVFFRKFVHHVPGIAAYVLYGCKYKRNEVKWLGSTSHFHRETIKRAKHSLRISCRMKLFHYICKAV